MKLLRFAVLAVVATLFPATVSAQLIDTKHINAQSSGITSCNEGIASADCATFQVPNNASSVTFSVSGSFTGTLQFEGSVDGVVWLGILVTNINDGVTSTSTTSAGSFSISNTGLMRVRVRASTFTPGTPARISATRGSGTYRAAGGAPGTGDIESVSAGAGLTGGGASGPVTLNIGSSTSITVNADDIAVATAGVTLAMMANLAQDQFIGRTTASTGVPETATITAAARTVLDDTTVGAMVDTLFGAGSTGTGGAVRATSPTIASPIISSYLDLPEVTAFPGSPASGWTVIVTDDSATGACDSAAGSARSLCVYNGSAWVSLGDGGAGGGAPTSAQYWTGAADGTLSNERNLGALSTALVINTAGVPSAYAGISCTNQFPRALSAVGAATCASVVNADIDAAAAIALTKLANQAADTVLANVTAGSAPPTAVSYATLATEMGIVSMAAAPGSDSLAFYQVSQTEIDWMTIPTGFATWFATPSCVNFAAVTTDETGSGACVHATSPQFTTSITTDSTTFALFNTTATTINAFGAASTINVGANAASVFNLGGFTTAAEFRLLEPSGSGTNYTAFKVGAQGGNITYTLPATGASAGQVLTDVAGNNTLSWTTPAGGGNVSKVGTPVNNQIGVWTGDGSIEGTADFTYDNTNLNLVTAKNFQIAGVTILADASGTTTLSAIDAIDGTTETTVEAAIDTLANLTSIQGSTFTLTGNFIRSGAHSLTITTTGATSVTFPTSGTLLSSADAPIRKYYDLAICQGSTATVAIGTFTSNAPTAECFGTNVRDARLVFPDTTDLTEIQGAIDLPASFSSITMNIVWSSSGTGNVVPQVWVACTSHGDAPNDTWVTTTPTTSAQMDANDDVLFSQTLTTTGCVGNDRMNWRIGRENDHGSDTLNATWRPFKVWVEVIR